MSGIQYSLSVPNPNDHILHIQIMIKTGNSEDLELILPDWRPGRYQLTNYAANIRGISAKGKDGNLLSIKKTKRNRWTLVTEGIDTVFVEYTYYANKMDAGNSVINDRMIYVNFINCLMYIPEYINESVKLTFQTPPEYKVVCPLKIISDTQFEAIDYYELVDSPFLASESICESHYSIDNINFTIAIHGDCTVDEKTLISSFKKFSQTQIKTFGEFPTDNYTFIIIALPYRFYHGVEHKTSTVITLGPNTSDNNDKFFHDLLGVSSHELVHAWNVSHIRPAELLPYDFSSENYYDTGFVTEGMTTYYGDLFLARSNNMSEEQFINELNTHLKRHMENYGRHDASILEASFDLWVDGYGSPHPRRKVSIYVKGAILALMTDLWIRRSSKNQNSLDDVFRDLWNGYGSRGIGYSTKDIYDILLEYGGSSFHEFIHSCIEGVVPIESLLNELLDFVGLQLTGAIHPEHCAAYYGFRLRKNVIFDIAPDSEANTSLSIGDSVIKVNNLPIDEFDWSTNDGLTIELLIERYGEERSIVLSRGKGNYFNIYEINPLSETTSAQERNKLSWLSGNKH